MSAPPAAETRKERLSTGQMLHLMRLEVERALRHRYPINCMVIGLDGFMKEEELVHRRTVMPAIFRKLKEVTFENDVRGLGVWAERFQVAVFPHVQPDELCRLADQLVERARVVENPLDRPVTISVGIAHNLHEGQTTFDDLLGEAESGMGLAMAAGGDRCILAREVETEIDRLKEELEVRIQEIREHQEDWFGALHGEQEDWGRGLVSKVIDSFKREADQSEGVVRLKKEVIELITGELHEWRESSTARQMMESQRQIEMLERRVQKLTESLGVTERELKRLAAMKNVDLGLSSIYRTVQGLGDDEENAEQKHEMLKNIFEANLALKGELAAAKTS